MLLCATAQTPETGPVEDEEPVMFRAQVLETVATVDKDVVNTKADDGTDATQAIVRITIKAPLARGTVQGPFEVNCKIVFKTNFEI